MCLEFELGHICTHVLVIILGGETLGITAEYCCSVERKRFAPTYF